MGHDPPCKATEGWWQQIALHLRQISRNGGIRPGTATHLSPAGDTVLDINRVLQAVTTPSSWSQHSGVCMLHNKGQGKAPKLYCLNVSIILIRG